MHNQGHEISTYEYGMGLNLIKTVYLSLFHL